MEDPLSSTNIIYLGLSIVFLIFLSAVFSGSETAFTALGKHKLRDLFENETDSKKKNYLKKFFENPNQYLTTVLIMNNIVNILASSLTTVFVSTFFPAAGKSVAVATGALTLMILIFGEITPKVYAKRYHEKFFKFTFKLIRFLNVLLTPLVWFLVKISSFVIKISGGDPIGKDDTFITENDLMSFLDIGHEEGIIEKEEKYLMQRSLEMRETSVREIMTPRVEIAAAEDTETVKDIIKIINEEGYSRIPVFKENIDNVTGIFYAKDLFKIINNKNTLEEVEKMFLVEFAHKPFFVPVTMKAKDLLKLFLSNRTHMAIVVDEYGGTAGLVTLEDVIEELTGEILDEYDDLVEESNITKIDENCILVNGSTPINDIERELDADFPDTEFETVSGFLLEQLERFPKPGEKVIFDNYEFEVVSITVNKIDKVKVTLSVKSDNFTGDDDFEQ